jgi:hypothetical protein
LEVTDLGPIGLPLTARQAKELKEHCEQAPYGKGDETLLDPQVRRVWRLAPDRFELANPAWQGCLKKVVAKVQAELGLEKQPLEPHLYELLLYEKGEFLFASPRRRKARPDGGHAGDGFAVGPRRRRIGGAA